MEGLASPLGVCLTGGSQGVASAAVLTSGSSSRLVQIVGKTQ